MLSVRIIFTALSIVFLAFLSTGIVSAGEMPKSWPWEGVTVNNLSFTPEELVVIKNKLPRMNSIRLTLLPRQTAQKKNISPADAWIDMVGWTHRMLDTCRKHGIVAVISVHQFPLDPAVKIQQTNPTFWASPKYRDEVIDFVDRMAMEFATRGDELVAFEVLSEPFVEVNKRPVLPKEWPELMRRIVSTIRSHTDKWIVVTPGPGGLPRGYRNFSPLNDSHIVYGAHMYEPHTFALQGIGQSRPIGSSYPGWIGPTYWDQSTVEKTLLPLRDFQNTYHVPVWIGEFSATRWAEGGEQYLLDIISTSKKYSWGWAYFNLGGFHGWDPEYDSNFPIQGEQPAKIGYSSARWKLLDQVLGE